MSLAANLLSEALLSRGVTSVDTDSAAMIEAYFDRCRDTWPTLEVSVDTFAAYIASRLTAGGGLSEFVTLRTDVYLACACLAHESSALAFFQEHLVPVMEMAVARVELPYDCRRDIVQELVAGVLVEGRNGRPMLADYQGFGTLAAWLRTVAFHAALKKARHRGKTVAFDEDLELVMPADEPWLASQKQVYAQEFRGAVRSVLAQMAPRDKNLLRQYYIDRLTIDELASLYGIHRATAARRLSGLRQDLLDATKASLAAALDVEDAASLLRIIQSHLSASIFSLLEVRDVA